MAPEKWGEDARLTNPFSCTPDRIAGPLWWPAWAVSSLYTGTAPTPRRREYNRLTKFTRTRGGAQCPIYGNNGRAKSWTASFRCGSTWAAQNTARFLQPSAENQLKKRRSSSFRWTRPRANCSFPAGSARHDYRIHICLACLNPDVAAWAISIFFTL